MTILIQPKASGRRVIRNLQICAVSAALVAGFSGMAFAETEKVDAKLAIERAQADIDMISQENPAATGDQSFATAQQKLADAHAAMANDRSRDAMWLANEAELLADTTAGKAKLAGMENTRREIAHDVDVLASALNKSEQAK